MKHYYLILSFFICHFAFSQQDSTQTVIVRLREFSVNGKKVQISKNSKSTQCYRIVEAVNKNEVDYLNSMLSQKEVEHLIMENNSTLKSVGLIIYLSRHNSKTEFLQKINEILKENYACLHSGSYDTTAINTLPQYILSLVTEENEFLKPNFKFDEKEIREFEIEFIKYQNRASR